MKYGICNLSLLSVRKEPNHRSELVNQLLFGEHFEIKNVKGDWAYIKSAHDDYEGWVAIDNFKAISESYYQKISNVYPEISGDLVQLIVNETKQYVIPILLGSSLPLLVNGEMYLDDEKYTFDGTLGTRKKIVERNDVIQTAYMYLNSPYLWGGRSPFGIDCSGFVQMVFKINGIELPRDAYQQVEHGETLSFLEEAKPGDVAFFDDENGNIVHTGILLSSSSIIHASGKVRIDTIDHHGIFNIEKKKYTHKLRVIKRII